MNLDRKVLIYSLSLGILLPFLVPSAFFTEGMGVYKFGIPFPYISVYQHVPSSMWLGGNLFNGNVGLSVNPLTFILNIIVVYFVVQFISSKFKKQQSKVDSIENLQ